jgi:hypothetical protein
LPPPTAEAAAKMRTPAEKFPTNFDYDVASEGASAKIKDVSQKLAAAFAAGDAAAADALFSYDASAKAVRRESRIVTSAELERSTEPAARYLAFARQKCRWQDLLLDRLQHQRLQIGVAHHSVVPGGIETFDLARAVEIDRKVTAAAASGAASFNAACFIQSSLAVFNGYRSD